MHYGLKSDSDRYSLIEQSVQIKYTVIIMATVVVIVNRRGLGIGIRCTH